jgi:hypothetical protein
VSLLHHDVQQESFALASRFRDDFYACLRTRRDELFELTDALLCADGPVTTPVDLTLLAEHRRGHGALYAALSNGCIDVARLRRTLTALPQPRAADDRLVLAVDVSNWLRPDAPTSADRLFCHTYGGLGEDGRGQEVVVGRLRVLQGQGPGGSGVRDEADGVVAGRTVGGEDVRAVAQRVRDVLGVVVGGGQRALVPVDGRVCRSSLVVTGGAK